MVGTLPEAGLVIDGIQRAVGMTAPVPLALFIVDQLRLDIIPTTTRLFQGILITEVLIF